MPFCAPPFLWTGTASSKWSGGLVAIGLDPIAVGIDNEGRIVVRAIVGAQPRFAVVAAAMADRGLVKGIDAFPRRGREAEMQPGVRVGRNRTWAGTDPECGVFVAVAERAFRRTETRIADRLQRSVVECLGFRNVSNADGYVIDHHGCPPSRGSSYAVRSGSRAWVKLLTSRHATKRQHSRRQRSGCPSSASRAGVEH